GFTRLHHHMVGCIFYSVSRGSPAIASAGEGPNSAIPEEPNQRGICVWRGTPSELHALILGPNCSFHRACEGRCRIQLSREHWMDQTLPDFTCLFRCSCARP